MSYKTDLGRVAGLGSAKEGAAHWFKERVMAVALIPLTLAFLCIVAPLIGAEHAIVMEKLGKPFNAILIIMFLLVTFQHLADGLQVVIEDYIHGKAALLILLIGTKLGCWAFGLAGIFAVAKIAFQG